MRTLTLLLSILLATAAFAQNHNAEIEKDFKDYFVTLENKQHAKTLEYIYPKLFDLFPKDLMLESLSATMSDTDITISISRGEIKKISSTLEADGKTFALVDYTFTMTMQMNPGTSSTATDMTYDILKGTYGEKNIIYNREKKEIIINVSNQGYAIKDPAYSGWKFLEKKKSMKELYEKLLPSKVLKKLK